MTLAKAPTKWLAAVALGLCLIPALIAQNKTSSKSGRSKSKSAKQASLAQAAKPAPATVAAAAGPAPSEKIASAGRRRDPFLPLINERKELAGPEHLPPGKGGLVITTVRVDGTVQSEEGMIAVLSNADQRTYFVREGDRLYDGEVEKIGLDGVTFRQDSKDAFGKPVERVVTKRIYASAGEQQ